MGAFLQELFRARIYKRTQGRIVRQATFYTIAVVLAYAAYRLGEVTTGTWTFPVRTASSVALFLVGGWIAYRLVNFPTFADFLISVEAEMNKVSWPNRTELYRASVVVIVVMFVMAGAIYLFDIGLSAFAGLIRIR